MAERFTAWLSDAERAGIRRLAVEYGTSENFVVRSAIRATLGMSSTIKPPDDDATRAEDRRASEVR